MDRYPGAASHRGGDLPSHQHGGRAPQADHRPGERHHGRLKAIRRTRAVSRTAPPGGSFIFLGPSVSARPDRQGPLTEFLFGDERPHQLDMSEYMEAHVSRLVGSPPGSRLRRGGQLTRPSVASRSRSCSSTDREGPRTCSTLPDPREGRLTGPGPLGGLQNTVIIMTSNLGTRDLTRRRWVHAEDTGSATGS